MNDCFWYQICACDCEYGQCFKYLSINSDKGNKLSEQYQKEIDIVTNPVKERYKRIFNHDRIMQMINSLSSELNSAYYIDEQYKTDIENALEHNLYNDENFIDYLLEAAKEIRKVFGPDTKITLEVNNYDDDDNTLYAYIYTGLSVNEYFTKKR